MVIRKSNFVSVCLLALAISISLTEYIMHSPNSSSVDIDDDEIFSTAIESASEELENKSDIQTFNESDNSKDKDIVIKDLEKNQDNVSKNQNISNEEDDAEPFKNSNEYKAIIKKGDTFASVLAGLGFDKTDIYLASKSLTKVFNLRNLKIGQEITIRSKKDDSGDIALDNLEFRPDYRYKIVVKKTENGFFAERLEIPLKKVVKNISAKISPKSPMHSLIDAGIKQTVASEAIRILSQIANIKNAKNSIDFECLYQDLYDEEGNSVGSPKLLYASILLDGKIQRIYKFDNNNGLNEYVDSNGTILSTLAKSKSALINPINSMKITSRFGSRTHPVTGRVHRHTGVDLSASIGTPIKAAASGIITKASFYSGYGRYIKISHNGNISTAYGHLSRISVRTGQYVKQGQIIGYTGASGVATGPHLHYEVLKNNQFVNPMLLVKQEPQKLVGQSLHKFNQMKKEVNLQIVGLSPSISQNFNGNSKKLS